MDNCVKKTYPRQSRHSHMNHTSPSIMESMNNFPSILDPRHQPDLTSLTIEDETIRQSFLLIDGNEHLKVASSDQFIKSLGLKSNNQHTKVKVISIFGNTGDGKSFTMNHTFFNGEKVFKTSSEQDSCTLGVWAAYDPENKVICLDTEGLLGVSKQENQRTRLLLKVLAISDIVLYRTKSERLHSDLFTFLGSASRAFTQHFHNSLQNVGLTKTVSAMGPSVIIFHETRHTRTLQTSLTESAEDCLRHRFSEMKLEIDAFSSLKYVGLQTSVPPTNFTELKNAVVSELDNTTVRSPRAPSVVYETLKVLNDKFSGSIDHESPLLFPDKYFTCPELCLSCGKRCESSMGHLKENISHTSSSRCKYQHQYENCIYLCKKCYANGIEQKVEPQAIPETVTPWFGVAKYVWSGYSIDCPNCGEIYTSRQYWYGNKTPEQCENVRTEITHVWSGCQLVDASNHVGQRVVDGVTFITQTVTNVSSQPTKFITSWVTDQIAPSYWRPNHEIKTCHSCAKWFQGDTSKHHCRSCGEGFCEECSSHTMSVPQHGWDYPVRVCDLCFNKSNETDASIADDKPILVRKYGEVVVNTLSSVATVLQYPKEIIKETARPLYWVPDNEIKHCSVCSSEFSPKVTLHHCRDCGRGVCSTCSNSKKPVAYRGWFNPVRVCDECFKKD